jgi:O-antigen/teichoic acid export membrane protein
VSWNVIAKVASQGGSFIGTIVLTRLLPVSDFGLVAMAQVYLLLLQQFVDAGFLDGLIQRPKLTQAELAGTFWLLAAAGAAAFVCSLVAKDLIEAALGMRGLGWIVVVQSSMLLFLPFRTVANALLAREVLLQEISKRETVVQALRLVASMTMAWAGAGVWSLVCPAVAAEMLFSLSCYRRAGWRLTREFSWDAVRPLARFGFDITLSRLVWFAGNRADQFIVGRVLGATSLGLYSLAQQFSSVVPQLIGAATARVVFPVFSRLQGETDRLRRTFLNVTRYTAYAALPAFAGIALVAPDLFAVMLKPSWSPAVVPTQVLCLLAFLKMMETNAGFLINARGSTRRSLRLNVLVLAATVAGVAGGTILGRLSWVALCVTIACAPASLLFVRAAIHECGSSLRAWLGEFTGPALATMLMATCVAAFGAVLPADRHLLRLMAMVGLGAVVYAAATYRVTRALISELRGRRSPTQGAVLASGAGR